MTCFRVFLAIALAFLPSTLWGQETSPFRKLDEKIAENCRKESRILITLDTGFSDIRAYPPKEYAGIVLLRPHRQSEPQIVKLLEAVLPMFQSEPIGGFLWIVEPAGVRIR
jgi:predicted nuclease of predicted toxin-antitoxin system